MTPGARGALAATLAALFVTGSAARFQVDTEPLGLELLRELVAIRSSEGYPEETRRLLEGLAKRLHAAGGAQLDRYLDSLSRRSKHDGLRSALCIDAHV